MSVGRCLSVHSCVYAYARMWVVCGCGVGVFGDRKKEK